MDQQELEQLEEDLKIPEARTQFDPYTVLTKEFDEEQQALIADWLNEPLVEYMCELNPDKQQSVDYFDKVDGKHKRAWIFDMSPTVNGVRWNIQPGKNKVPKSLYEAMMDTIDIARSLQPKALSANSSGKQVGQISRN